MIVPGRRDDAGGLEPARKGLVGGVIAGDGVTLTWLPPRDCDSEAGEATEEVGYASSRAGGSEGVELWEDTMRPGEF